MTPPPRPFVRLTDSHCHLDMPDFNDQIPEILNTASANGVHRMVTICTRPRNAHRARALADAHAPIYWAAGLHPMHVEEEPAVSVEALVDLAAHPKMIGIGETGLDYHYTRQSAAAQRQSLRLHIETARRTRLPLIVHARDADTDIARLLRAEHRAGPFSCVLHCFSAGAALAQTALDLGAYLSMSAIAVFPKSVQLREIFASVPLERILVETDSPYLAPPPFRGKRNQPAFVRHVAERGAQIFGLDLPAFAAITEANFERLFWKAAPARTAQGAHAGHSQASGTTTAKGTDGPGL